MHEVAQIVALAPCHALAATGDQVGHQLQLVEIAAAAEQQGRRREVVEPLDIGHHQPRMRIENLLFIEPLAGVMQNEGCALCCISTDATGMIEVMMRDNEVSDHLVVDEPLHFLDHCE